MGAAPSPLRLTLSCPRPGAGMLPRTPPERGWAGAPGVACYRPREGAGRARPLGAVRGRGPKPSQPAGSVAPAAASGSHPWPPAPGARPSRRVRACRLGVAAATLLAARAPPPDPAPPRPARALLGWAALQVPRAHAPASRPPRGSGSRPGRRTRRAPAAVWERRTRAGDEGVAGRASARSAPREPARKQGRALPGVPGGGGSQVPRFPAIASIRPGAPGPGYADCAGPAQDTSVQGGGALLRDPHELAAWDWGRDHDFSPFPLISSAQHPSLRLPFNDRFLQLSRFLPRCKRIPLLKF